ncbi:uncharacterized protein PAE49_012461 isoform 1-T2 [Odontesthes bonariensis]|uniref:uncharacterized protein LOC142396259 n=1 Tax=Odontesthes bonariensis TaxID=219752 RepID=UPI003F5874FA
MPAFSPPASLLFTLLCASAALQRFDLYLACVTHNSFFYYSCSQEPQPCSASSLTDSRCKDIRSQLHSAPDAEIKTLTVWFTSPPNVSRLLNNLDVRHLTLIRCGPGGSKAAPNFSLDEYFAVKRLERLTVINLPERPFPHCPEANRAKSTDLNTDPDRDNGFHFDTNGYNRDRDTNMDLGADTRRDSLVASQIQDIFLGRELGAAYHEQVRLGIIHSSVLDWGAALKAYTIQTHIDSDGALPFPGLKLSKLEETSVIYVSFVY